MLRTNFKAPEKQGFVRFEFLRSTGHISIIFVFQSSAHKRSPQVPVAVGMTCPCHMLTLQRGVLPVNTSASYLRLCTITSLISSTLTWWQSLNMAPLIGRTTVGSGCCLRCHYQGMSSLVIRLIRTPWLKVTEKNDSWNWVRQKGYMLAKFPRG